MEKEYAVSFQIFLYAEDERDAAEQMLGIMRDPHFLPGIRVWEKEEFLNDGKSTFIDLDDYINEYKE